MTNQRAGKGLAKRGSPHKESKPPATAPSRRMDVQFLRVIAVLSVTIFHFAPGFVLVPQGYLGVDMFFTISGFVITAQMLRAKDAGTWSYPGFLASRVRRLLPSAVFVIAVSMLAILILGNPVTAESESRAAGSALLYVANFFFAHRAVDYFAQGQESAFIHFWSLSVEEQFYIFWPIAFITIAWFAIKRRLTFTKTLAAFAIITAALSLLGATWAMAGDPTRAFFMPWWRVQQLMIGALVAIALHATPTLFPTNSRITSNIITATRVLCVLWLIGLVLQPSNLGSPGWQNLLVSLPVAFILATPQGNDPLTTTGALKPLAWIATGSYVIYLWHWPIWILLKDKAPANTNGYLLITFALITTLTLATLTHTFIERPLHRTFIFPTRNTLIAALVSCVVLALAFVVISPVVASARVGGAANLIQPPITKAYEDRSPVLKNGCFVAFDSSELKTCIDNPGRPQKIVLAGDSHAAQWQGVLSQVIREENATLITTTRAGCPIWDVRSDYGAKAIATCSSWRAKFFAYVRKTKPDVVIISQYASTPFVTTDNRSPEGQEKATLLESAVQESIDKLNPYVGRVIFLEDTPSNPANPLSCLATARLASDCAFANQADSVDRVTIRQAVKNSGSAHLVDPYPTVCPRKRCPVAIENRLVYYDGGHLTNSYALTLSPWVKGWLDTNLQEAHSKKGS